MENELRRQVREIIAGFSGRGTCDVVTDLGELYPTQVILTMFGLPLEDRDSFLSWTKIIVSGASAAPSDTTSAQLDSRSFRASITRHRLPPLRLLSP